jgi:proteasome assembly chaperone (PAC2) family protein
MDSGKNLEIIERPRLRDPYLVCGISGWVDGGSAATGSVQYLIRRLKATRFAEIPISHFHIFQLPGQTALRPRVKMRDGLLLEHQYPGNHFFSWANPIAPKDVVFFLGNEPNLHWDEYAEALLELVAEFSVSRIYLLGGVLDRCPHTVEPNVSCACTSEALKEEMSEHEVGFGDYEGPGRFGSTLMFVCQQRGIEMVSLTGTSTVYPEFDIMIPANPKAIRALVRRLIHLINIELDTGDLDQWVKSFEGKVDFVVSQSPQLKAYVQQLEKTYKEASPGAPLGLSGEEAVEMAQEFLRKDQDRP